MAAHRQPDEARSEASSWAAFATDYEQKVFSPTSFPARRRRLIEGVNAGDVLVAGAGPLGLLERDLLDRSGVRVTSSDFCREMLIAAGSNLRHDRLAYVAADNRLLPFRAASIDTVISVNSIVPESRDDAGQMFSEFARVLRPRGRLIALLPSFEMSLESLENWRAPVILDHAGRREYDTTGWQCFHTRQDIADAMHSHGFSQFTVERMEFSSREETAHIARVYANLLAHSDADALTRFPLWEHLLIAIR